MKGFYVCDEVGNVWRNGREVSRQFFGKSLTAKELELFNKIVRKYFNQQK